MNLVVTIIPHMNIQKNLHRAKRKTFKTVMKLLDRWFMVIANQPRNDKNIPWLLFTVPWLAGLGSPACCFILLSALCLARTLPTHTSCNFLCATVEMLLIDNQYQTTNTEKYQQGVRSWLCHCGICAPRPPWRASTWWLNLQGGSASQSGASSTVFTSHWLWRVNNILQDLLDPAYHSSKCCLGEYTHPSRQI